MKTNRQGYLVSDTHRECTKCRTIFEITSKRVVLCKECNSTRVKSMSPEDRMYRRAKMRCKENGRDSTITIDDIIIPTHCPILGIELKVCKGQSGGAKNSPSLDRIDCSKGYVPGNVWVISRLANQMKANANEEELQLFAKWVSGRS